MKTPKLRAVNIKWGPDIDDAINMIIDKYSHKAAAKLLDMTVKDYVRLNDDERVGRLYKYFKKNPNRTIDVLNIPRQMDIPLYGEQSVFVDDSDLMDYLSDQTGWLLDDFDLETNMSPDDAGDLFRTLGMKKELSQEEENVREAALTLLVLLKRCSYKIIEE